MTLRDDDIRSRLGNLGLTEREARLYLELLENGESTASQLAVATRIPQNKIYQPIKSLLDAGLCRRKRHGRQRLFSAVDPSVALARPLKDLEHRLEGARALTRDLGALFATSRPPTDNLGDVEILSDREAIRERYMQLLTGTEREVAGFARGPYAFGSREELEAQFAVGRQLRQRCLTRWVYELNLDRDQLLIEFLRGFGDEGDIRVSRDLPLKMVLFDSHTIIFTDDRPDAPEAMSVAIMHHPAVVHAFSTLFEFFWRHAQTISDWFAVGATDTPSR